MPRELPERIGKYVIKRLLGKGGMGLVYHGYDPIIGRDVALKVMAADLAEDQVLKERFIREAQSAGRLRHPHIVTIYDLGEEDGVPYIAMEYLEGKDLDEYIRKKLPLTFDERLEIIRQCADALGYAHQQGIVHRDIKPANIRLVGHINVKIMDFGIAKMGSSQLTQTGIIMGTPHYMAPEQIRDLRDKIDGRTDIFALGVVLYELLCGRRPFDGEHATTVFYKIVHEPPPPLDCDEMEQFPELEVMVLRALAKDPDDRYQNAYELARDVADLQARLRSERPTVHTVSRPGTEELESTGVPEPAPAPATPTTGEPSAPSVADTEAPTVLAEPTPTPTAPPQTIRPTLAPRTATWKRVAWLTGVLAVLVLVAGVGLLVLNRTREGGPDRGQTSVIAQQTRPTVAEPDAVEPTAPVPPEQEPVQEETTPPGAATEPREPAPPTTLEPVAPEAKPGPAEPAEAQPGPPPTEPQPLVQLPRETGVVLLDTKPWSRIVRIVHVATGLEVPLPREPITPIRLVLPVGRLRITLEYPAYRQQEVREMQIVAGQVLPLFIQHPRFRRINPFPPR